MAAATENVTATMGAMVAETATDDVEMDVLDDTLLDQRKRELAAVRAAETLRFGEHLAATLPEDLASEEALEFVRFPAAAVLRDVCHLGVQALRAAAVDAGVKPWKLRRVNNLSRREVFFRNFSRMRFQILVDSLDLMEPIPVAMLDHLLECLSFECKAPSGWEAWVGDALPNACVPLLSDRRLMTALVDRGVAVWRGDDDDDDETGGRRRAIDMPAIVCSVFRQVPASMMFDAAHNVRAQLFQQLAQEANLPLLAEVLRADGCHGFVRWVADRSNNITALFAAHSRDYEALVAVLRAARFETHVHSIQQFAKSYRNSRETDAKHLPRAFYDMLLTVKVRYGSYPMDSANDINFLLEMQADGAISAEDTDKAVDRVMRFLSKSNPWARYLHQHSRLYVTSELQSLVTDLAFGLRQTKRKDNPLSIEEAGETPKRHRLCAPC